MTTVAIARSQTRVVVRVQGRGTRAVARAIDRFSATIEPQDELVVDLAPTEAVESAFLGCLAALAKRLRSRFAAAGSPAHLKHLFGRTGLERLVAIQPEAPPADDYAPLDEPAGDDARSLAAFVAACHRHLAACGGTDAAMHLAVAERLEQELAKAAPAAAGPGLHA
jgi:anti-anti-sigma regulatory factor